MKVAHYLRTEVVPVGGAAVLDADPQYWDLQIGFFSGLPEERLARQRWDIFRERVVSAKPDTVVRHEGEAWTARLTCVLRGRRFISPAASSTKSRVSLVLGTSTGAEPQHSSR